MALCLLVELGSLQVPNQRPKSVGFHWCGLVKMTICIQTCRHHTYLNMHRQFQIQLYRCICCRNLSIDIQVLNLRWTQVFDNLEVTMLRRLASSFGCCTWQPSQPCSPWMLVVLVLILLDWIPLRVSLPGAGEKGTCYMFVWWHSTRRNIPIYLGYKQKQIKQFNDSSLPATRGLMECIC